jgi:uncharacterized membrane protein YebE (DUF533 family)
LALNGKNSGKPTEKRKAEIHPHKLAAAASHSEREQSNAIIRAIAVAAKMEGYLPSSNSRMAA